MTRLSKAKKEKEKAEAEEELEVAKMRLFVSEILSYLLLITDIREQ